jgi:addiction module HigA family antidote
MRIATSPGEMLAEEFMWPLGLDAARLADALGVPQNLITGIINGESAITADVATKLGRRFRVTPQFWINVQSGYNASVLAAVEHSQVRNQNRGGALDDILEEMDILEDVRAEVAKSVSEPMFPVG